MMTLEECKKLHKDMWEFVKEQENLTHEDRHYLKASYCAENGMHLLNHCALCSYAQQKAFEQGDYEYDNMCQYCPAIWGTEDICDTFYCEYYRIYPIAEHLNWRHSPCDDIIGIKWKDEVE